MSILLIKHVYGVKHLWLRFTLQPGTTRTGSSLHLISDNINIVGFSHGRNNIHIQISGLLSIDVGRRWHVFQLSWVISISPALILG